MKKRKDGKIVASLTEVKNKTGDIFALVDEFGEVLLTSYNKPKYRIIKVDITEVLNLNVEKEDDSQHDTMQAEKKSFVSRVKEVLSGASNRDDENQISIDLIPKEVRELLKNMSVWNANSKIESRFVKSITTPLQ